MSSLSNSIIDFSLLLTRYVLQNSTEINLSISATSIYLALAMIQAGSKQKSSLELKKMLGADFSALLCPHHRNSHLYVSVKKTYEQLSQSGELANKIFTAIQLKKDYTHLLAELFNVTDEVTSFQPPAIAVKKINQWVADRTHGRITNLLQESVITPDSVMVLINTLFFKGSWKDSFDQKLTQDGEFHLETGNAVTVPFMVRKGKERVYRDKKDRFRALILDFESGNKVGVFLLPKESTTLKQLISTLKVSHLKKFFERSQIQDVNIQIPKFKIDQNTEVKRVLKDLGVTSIFDKSKSDLSNMSELPLWVEDIIHRSTVEIDEKGVVAAAATAVIIGRTSYIPDNYFQANRPFIFIIMDKKSGIPLFMNAIYDPSKS